MFTFHQDVGIGPRCCVMCIILFYYVVLTSCTVKPSIYVEESSSHQFCDVNAAESGSECGLRPVSKLSQVSRPRYILYDVNPPEGFNLRRDVYMRMAIFASKLPKSEDWHLVLPPWSQLYHWRSKNVGRQRQLPWGNFFDVTSLKKFAPVVEMYEFLEDYATSTIEQVFVLQHYKDAFKNNDWVEKFDIEQCQDNIPYRLETNGTYSGWFWGYANVSAHRVVCLSFHGLASQLKDVATNFTSVMFDHAEIALHDFFGDRTYWRARRSMRFAKHLRLLADEYRQDYLDSTDEKDGTELPEDWTLETAHRNARGGSYICAHLRRQDFLWGRPKDVPSISSTAQQIKYQLDKLKLDTLFVATDSSTEEMQELRQYLDGYRVLRYKSNQTVEETCKDGGLAIIEQIICSHARYFIGTHESTFSFRIQEEREILGFPLDATFNRLCGDNDVDCKPPSRWKIVF